MMQVGYDGTHRPDSQGIWKIALLLAVLTFAVNWYIGSVFAEHRLIDQLDVFFDADTEWRVNCMSIDKCGGRSTVAHPAIPLLFTPAADVLAEIFPNEDPAEFRRQLSIGLSVAASALKTAVVLLLFYEIGIALAPAILLTLLVAGSFTSLMFGSIPETFPLSGALLALGFLWAAREINGDEYALGYWVALGAVVTGITITNIIPVVILYGASRWQGFAEWKSLFLKMTICGLLIVAVTGVLTFFSYMMYPTENFDTTEANNYVFRWIRADDLFLRAWDVITGAAHSFAAPVPVVGGNLSPWVDEYEYKFQYTFDRNLLGYTWMQAAGFVCVILMVIGAWLAFTQRVFPKHHMLLWAAILIITFNSAIHTVWGREKVLYSQHWHAAATLMLICGLTALPSRLLKVFLPVLVIAVLATNAWSLISMVEMLDTIDQVELPEIQR